ncbi:asparaginase [Bacillus sp. RG28]|uniref:asparaginase n=1 Tax=Gottfriedia endophytica TaxID=2820819 RepID=A0A940NHP0_9BACI|nr:asparaginase [Gottfriedia endophytica]MBP0724227.1 asparaginase [Gottfriedia endophytica]
MKKILVLHTGGTIAMKEDQATGTVTTGQTNPLLNYSTKENDDVQLIVEDILHLPSPHMTPVEMLKLKKRIDQAVIDDAIDGVVITHGTDTLEETAYFLDLTVKHTLPIVITGAMRSSNEIGSDGLYNFQCAILVALSEQAKNKGVLVVMNDDIHTARHVTKTHTSNVATFRSPTFGPIGIISKSQVFFHQSLISYEKFDVKSVDYNVPLLKSYAGMDNSIFEALQNMPLDGLVIEALGAGNLPPKTLPGLQKLLDSNIPIVLVSRCFNGITQDVYGYEGGGKQLKNMGLIFSNGLNGQKARIKLLIALSITNNQKDLDTIFHS